MDCEKIKKSLFDFFKNSITVKSDGKECKVILPIYGRNNDLIELYIRESSLKEKGKYYITDDAETISALYLLGMEIEEAGKPKSILDSIEKSHNIEIINGEIKAYAQDEDLGLIISKIISSILGVQYIQYLSRPSLIPAFKEKVRVFLDENSPEYESNPEVKGLTEGQKFDFGYKQFDLYLDSLHATTSFSANNQIIATCFKSYEVTKINSKLKVVAIYDDVDEESNKWWSSKTIHYMDSYLFDHVPWSKKEKLLEFIQ